MSKIVIVDDDDVVIVRRTSRRAELYRQLDYRQEQARKAAEYVLNCPCNPANGGSGICGCVNPYNTTWC
jgi:hypothetical protein